MLLEIDWHVWANQSRLVEYSRFCLRAELSISVLCGASLCEKNCVSVLSLFTIFPLVPACLLDLRPNNKFTFALSVMQTIPNSITA